MSDKAVLLLGDCLDMLKELPDNSVDSVVTDPPAGISFMGKGWDGDKGGRKQWIGWMSQVMSECLRVLKPGGHALVWAIPRTSHWTATAVEDAGFEVRDVVTHLFGSGFPKSMNIGIAIDKQSGAMGSRGKAFVTAGAGERKDIQNTSGWEKDPGHTGITPEAKQWQGWGTALKPAAEFWILARKPCSEDTVAKNVLLHGTGGINIDASRIGTIDKITNHSRSAESAVSKGKYGDSTAQGTHQTTGQALGRFPANLVFSHNADCVEAGVKKVGVGSGKSIPKKNNTMGFQGGDGTYNDFNYGTETVASFECTEGCAVAELDRQSRGPKDDSGGASRFFYVAKASKKDKGEGNIHPTIKSTTLMTYLIKLITPPNGIVLDPFMGSGTTGVAALKAGFDFIGIEQSPEYFEIAEKRVEKAA